MQNFRCRSAKGAPGGCGTPLRHNNFLYSQLPCEHPGMQWSGTAKRVQHKVARIKSLANRHLADKVGHLELYDLGDATGALENAHADPLAKCLDRVSGGGLVQLHPSACKSLGIYKPQHDIS